MCVTAFSSTSLELFFSSLLFSATNCRSFQPLQSPKSATIVASVDRALEINISITHKNGNLKTLHKTNKINKPTNQVGLCSPVHSGMPPVNVRYGLQLEASYQTVDYRAPESLSAACITLPSAASEAR